MALTIQQAFKTFQSNLEITDLQTATVSTRQRNVRDAVAAELSVVDSFLSGSYSRSTMIAPLSEADIDIFIVLDPKYYDGTTPAALLDRVKRALLKTYTKTPDISRNGQAVTITFTDFVVDVVPAFNRKGGGYLIPNSQKNEWLSTNPKTHVTISSKANTDHNGDLIPTIKMVKCWNREISRYFHSFHLEVLAWDVFNNVPISDFSSGVHYFFDKSRALVPQKNLDPAGYRGDVGGYLNQGTARDGVSRLDTALNRARKAEEFAKNGRTQAAIDEWRKVFGNRFPAYG